jgi:hypothetical protein
MAPPLPRCLKEHQAPCFGALLGVPFIAAMNRLAAVGIRSPILAEQEFATRDGVTVEVPARVVVWAKHPAREVDPGEGHPAHRSGPIRVPAGHRSSLHYASSR